jgi:hypothetical protein
MDAVKAQQELIRLLLKRLKACAAEHRALHGVLLNLPDRASAIQLMEHYRDSEPVKQKIDEQFRDLEELIERISGGIQEEELHTLLQRFDTTGKLPN